MKLFMHVGGWVGNFNNFLRDSFLELGQEVASSSSYPLGNKLISRLKLRNINQIRRFEQDLYLKKANAGVLEECCKFKPDVFIVFNENKLTPDTIRMIRERCKCLMVCFVADDPWDSSRWMADFPHSLRYFDIIFAADPGWNNNIRKSAPQARIFWEFGGYDESIFSPLSSEEMASPAAGKYECDLSFTGASYGEKAEGAYRSEILSRMADYDLRIWGDDNWEYRFKYLPELKKCYKGKRLSYPDLRRLYAKSKINLNLPSPQVILGFQPRVFEIGACQGFQVADSRMLLNYMFTEEELVSFVSIGELGEKVKYFLENETERSAYAFRLHERVRGRYTWQKSAARILKTFETGRGIESIDLLLMKARSTDIGRFLRDYSP